MNRDERRTCAPLIEAQEEKARQDEANYDLMIQAEKEMRPAATEETIEDLFGCQSKILQEVYDKR